MTRSSWERPRRAWRGGVACRGVVGCGLPVLSAHPRCTVLKVFKLLRSTACPAKILSLSQFALHKSLQWVMIMVLHLVVQPSSLNRAWSKSRRISWLNEIVSPTCVAMRTDRRSSLLPVWLFFGPGRWPLCRVRVAGEKQLGACCEMVASERAVRPERRRAAPRDGTRPNIGKQRQTCNRGRRPARRALVGGGVARQHAQSRQTAPPRRFCRRTPAVIPL